MRRLFFLAIGCSASVHHCAELCLLQGLAVEKAFPPSSRRRRSRLTIVLSCASCLLQGLAVEKALVLLPEDHPWQQNFELQIGGCSLRLKR